MKPKVMQPFIASSPLSIAPGRDRQFRYLQLRARKVFVNRDLHVNESHREYFFGKLVSCLCALAVPTSKKCRPQRHTAYAIIMINRTHCLRRNFYGTDMCNYLNLKSVRSTTLFHCFRWIVSDAIGAALAPHAFGVRL